MSEFMTVIELAQKLHIGTGAASIGLQQKRFPFGSAVQMQSGRWTYIIPRQAVENFCLGSLGWRLSDDSR